MARKIQSSRPKTCVGILLEGEGLFERYHASVGRKSFWSAAGNKRISLQEVLERSMMGCIAQSGDIILKTKWCETPPEPYDINTRFGKRDNRAVEETEQIT